MDNAKRKEKIVELKVQRKALSAEIKSFVGQCRKLVEKRATLSTSIKDLVKEIHAGNLAHKAEVAARRETQKAERKAKKEAQRVAKDSARAQRKAAREAKKVAALAAKAAKAAQPVTTPA